MSTNITINGITYNNIESVSVNGGIFSISSEYTEEVLRRNFNPDGQSFIDTVSINLAAGDYIEAQLDNTNTTDNKIVFFGRLKYFQISGKNISVLWNIYMV